MKLHPSVNLEMLEDAVHRQRFGLDNPGYCMACGMESDSCEPDARNYECQSCGEREVYGAEELFMAFV